MHHIPDEEIRVMTGVALALRVIGLLARLPGGPGLACMCCMCSMCSLHC